MKRMSRAANRHPSLPIDAVCSNSAMDIAGAHYAMMAITSADLVNNPGSARATPQLATALRMPNPHAANSNIAAVPVALLEPNTGGKKVCAACETPSPMTAKKK